MIRLRGWKVAQHDSNLPAVEVKQNANPARQLVPIVPNRPASGKENSSPIVYGQCSYVFVSKLEDEGVS